MDSIISEFEEVLEEASAVGAIVVGLVGSGAGAFGWRPNNDRKGRAGARGQLWNMTAIPAAHAGFEQSLGDSDAGGDDAGTTGTYTPMASKIVSGRAVWQKEGGTDRFVYYADGSWCIGESLRKNSDGGGRHEYKSEGEHRATSDGDLDEDDDEDGDEDEEEDSLSGEDGASRDGRSDGGGGGGDGGEGTAIAVEEEAEIKELVDPASQHPYYVNRITGKAACNELEQLQAWEDSPPDTKRILRAQKALNKAQKILKRSREDYAEEELAPEEDGMSSRSRRYTGAGDSDGELEELRQNIAKAQVAKQSAEAQLNALHDEALKAVSHFPEVASVVAADVPEELMRLWQPQKHLSDFNIIAQLQISGGRHRIYKVDVGNGQLAVLKEFQCVGDQRKYFFRELQRLHQLRHPCVMAVEAMFVDAPSKDHSFFYVQMPFCPGGDLDAFIRDRVSAGEMDGNGARLLLQRALRGIEYLHTKGIVHADLKPANILIDAKGVPRLTDFETSRDSAAGAATATLSKVGGTQGFTAPELHAKGAHPTPASDMFACGRLLAEARAAMKDLDTDAAGLDALDDLIAQLTHDDAGARPTIAQALEHRYFTTDVVEREAELLSKAEEEVEKAKRARQKLQKEAQGMDARKQQLRSEAEDLARRSDEFDERIRREQAALDADAQHNQTQLKSLQAKKKALQEQQATVQDRRVELEKRRAALAAQEASNTHLRPHQPGVPAGPAKRYELSFTTSVSFESHHFNLAAAQFMILLGGRRQRREVTRVEYYDNPDTRKRFEDAERAMWQRDDNTHRTWVFHGTADANIARIMEDGFQVGGVGSVPVRNGAAYGNGVYAATGPDTPIGYSHDSSKVILAQGLKGTFADAQQDRGGADSWRGGGADHVVFRKGEQLLPMYVVHFR
eukprot:g1926.t1